MKKEYVSPAVELIDVEPILMQATTTIEISEDPTYEVNARQLLLLNVIDE